MHRRQSWRMRVIAIVLAIALGGALFALGLLRTSQTGPAAEGAAASAPDLPAVKVSGDERSDRPLQTDRTEVVGAETPASSVKGARVAPAINWQKYQGSLGVQADSALTARNGAMAMDVANMLAECDAAAQLQDEASRRAGEKMSAEVQAITLERANERQRLLSNCQTVVGGHQAMRSRLLELAMQEKVVGAAAEIYSEQLRRQQVKQRPEVLEAMVADAFAGDVKTLVFVAAQGATTFGLSYERQQVLRYGFELAAGDREVGKALVNYLATSNSLSAALTDSRFDTANLSETTRAEGRALATRILARLRG